MKILIVSGSRADAGALEAVQKALVNAHHAVTWYALLPAVSDKRSSVAYAASHAMADVTGKLEWDPYDLVLLHGDRYEVLAAATAAFLMGKPFAHLSGGDVTEGSQDDSLRHAISKLSHLHFVTCEASAQRLMQMGEEPHRVHVVGCPGIDSLMKTELLSREGVLAAVGLPPNATFALVGYHPNTLGDTKAEVNELMKALGSIRTSGVAVVLTSPNRDADYEVVDRAFVAFAGHKHVIYFRDMPRKIYLSLLKHCVVLIGNSSAGFYEAPSFGTPVVNVGDRQKGRIGAPCLRGCAATQGAIFTAYMGAAYTGKPRTPCNPYGDGQAAVKIVEIIERFKHTPLLLKKWVRQWPSIQFGKESTIPVNGGVTPTPTSSDGWPDVTTGFGGDQPSGS